MVALGGVATRDSARVDVCDADVTARQSNALFFK